MNSVISFGSFSIFIWALSLAELLRDFQPEARVIGAEEVTAEDTTVE